LATFLAIQRGFKEWGTTQNFPERFGPGYLKRTPRRNLMAATGYQIQKMIPTLPWNKLDDGFLHLMACLVESWADKNESSYITGISRWKDPDEEGPFVTTDLVNLKVTHKVRNDRTGRINNIRLERRIAYNAFEPWMFKFEWVNNCPDIKTIYHRMRANFRKEGGRNAIMSVMTSKRQWAISRVMSKPQPIEGGPRKRQMIARAHEIGRQPEAERQNRFQLKQLQKEDEKCNGPPVFSSKPVPTIRSLLDCIDSLAADGDGETLEMLRGIRSDLQEGHFAVRNPWLGTQKINGYEKEYNDRRAEEQRKFVSPTGEAWTTETLWEHANSLMARDDEERWEEIVQFAKDLVKHRREDLDVRPIRKKLCMYHARKHITGSKKRKRDE
jgi:hypothetical protein